MMDKIEVNGPRTHDVYKTLKEKASVDNLTWNFCKFLVNRSGDQVSYYKHSQPPLSFEADIAKLLSEK